MKTVLHGHTSIETAYVIEDYPYGRLRTQMRIWVETAVKGAGAQRQRVGTQTLNPKNGRWNKPHYGIYSDMIVLYLNSENGHVENAAVHSCSWPDHLLNFKTEFYAQLNEQERKRLDMLERISRKLSPESWAKLENTPPAAPA